MASWPPKKNTAFVLYVGLISQADTKLLQANPTLAAGDVKVATDDGVPGNLATLPVVDADFTDRVKVSLSAGEMNGDRITVIFSDAAGAEWADLLIDIPTSVRQMDDLAFPTVSGRSTDVLATGEVPIDFDTSIGTLAAAQIEASALDGKGDWNIGKTGYALTQAFPTNFADLSIAVTTGLVDITQTAADKVWATAVRILTANTNLNDPTAAVIADAVQDEAIEDHDTQGTVGWATALSVYAGSDGPGIYIDSGAANTNTVVGTDGTEINPVSTFVAARTLADALGLKIYYLEGNSDITLAATHTDWEFIGLGSVMDNIINLGAQDVSRSLFRNLTVEGTQGGTGRITARDCALQDPGAGDTTLHIFAERCGFVDRIQIDTSADNVFDQCYSLVAGTAAPVIQATGATGTIAVRHYSGGMEFETLSASHNMTWEGIGQVIFNADCNVNANVSVRGIGSITDNTAGMLSLIETSLVNMTKINTEADNAIETYHLDHLIAADAADIPVNGSIIAQMVSITEDWSTFVPGTDSLEALQIEAAAIRNRLPTALVGGRMDSDVAVIQAAVIAAATFAADAVDANALATDAVQEIARAILPQINTAFSDIEFLFVAASDHVTPVTGATGTGVTRSIDGGAFGAGTGTLAEVGDGIYQYDASAADMNGAIITFRFTASGGTPGAPDDRFLTIITAA